jgi:hypothetical protein
MTTETNCTSIESRKSILFNRILYGISVSVSLISLLWHFDWMMASAYLGLALAFDPFDSKIKWNSRPLYQRAWLFIHATLSITLFILGIILKK